MHQQFSKTTFELLKQIASNTQTAGELAKKMKTSLANISQQTKLLEAQDLIKKTAKKTQKPGKPATMISLKKESTTIQIIAQKFVEQKQFNLTFEKKLLISLWMLLTQENAHAIAKLFFQQEDLFENIHFLGLLKKDKTSDLNLLIITKKESLHKLRGEQAKQVIHLKGSQVIINLWSHSPEEIKNGFLRNEAYYLSLKEELVPLINESQDNELLEILGV
ncbi:MAG: helix-turn-helix transcriptional regulator [Candidatus Woesearchaeota archaeon]|nr:MAG: helix-turn-helix transcriptional regulator [Candidatus Woesearchaeota archaeon]